MKKAMLFVLVCALSMLVTQSKAEAFGMGFYATTGDKTSDWTANGDRRTSKMEHSDAGITLDTNLAKERLFNYRFEFGKSNIDIAPFFDQGVNTKLEADGLIMSHAFGFGGQITPLLRFWLGPELRFTWVDGTLANDPNTDLDLFGFGFGAATGLNINLPGTPLTLGIKAGYSIMNYKGEGQYFDTGLGAYYWRDYDIDQDLTYVTAVLMFRTPGDR